MNLVPYKVTRTVARKVLLTKKHSPHIFFAGGMVGIVTSVVLACRATLKLEDTLDGIKKDIGETKTLHHSKTEVVEATAEYEKDLIYLYSKSGLNIARLYAPAIIVGSVSIAALTGAHIQLTRRNAALTATLVAVSKAFEDYRERIQEEIGVDKERDIYRALRDEKADAEEAELMAANHASPYSIYCRFFDESNMNYIKNSPEHNRIFLQAQQNYANHQLKARGHVFLNDVYDMLGMERSQAGAVVGWVNDGEGDNYIDFGMFELSSTRFINQIEPAILLDFNVDGVVYDKI